MLIILIYIEAGYWICYNLNMKKSLSATNPYLLNPSLKKEMVERFITSSSAIEGIYITHYKNPTSIKKRKATSRGKV